MFPPDFDYRRAETAAEALDLLGRDGARPIAGGQGLVQDLKLGEAEPELLVDVSGVDALGGVDREGDTLSVGALTTHADLAAFEAVAEQAPVLAAAAAELADRQVRNRGTVGGNLAEADPAADLPAAVLAADATIRIRGPDGERSVPADEFFEGPGETALQGDELLVSVEVPVHGAGAYAKKTHPATGYAMVGVAAVAAVEDGTVAEARVAANGVADRAVRLRSVEEAVRGAPAEADFGAAADRAGEVLDQDELRGDAHASAEFRGQLLGTYTERALDTAVETAGGEPA